MKIICNKVSEECNPDCDHKAPHDINSDVMCDTMEEHCPYDDLDTPVVCIPVEREEEPIEPVKVPVITDYDILSNHNSGVLRNQVKEAIRNGWELQGGVSCSIQVGMNSTKLFCQAMVKYE